MTGALEQDGVDLTLATSGFIKRTPALGNVGRYGRFLLSWPLLGL
jgi:hypothetical protein